MKKSETERRFDQLLQTMITQPVPSERPVIKARTSTPVASANYGDTRVREDKAASTSLKLKYTPH